MIDNRTQKRRVKDFWYSWHPADYAVKTAHLTAVQDGIYRRLLDHYYLQHGKVLANATILLRVCRAFDAAEIAAVHDMLAEFFTIRDGYYHHDRADHELEKRALLREKRAMAGSKGGKQKVANATILLDGCQTQLQLQSQTTRTRTEVEASTPVSSHPENQNLGESLLVRAEPEPTIKPASKPISSKVQRGTRWPAGQPVPDDWLAKAAANWTTRGLPVEAIAIEAEKFVAHWTAKAGKDATKVDWSAAWRTWYLNAYGVNTNGRTKGQFGNGRAISDHPLGIFAQLGDEIRERALPGSGGPNDHGGIPH